MPFCCPHERRRESSHRRVGDVTVEAQTTVRRPPEDARGKKGFCPRATAGSAAMPAPSFWASGLQNVRQ